MNAADWIDITTTIENGMVHWPGDEPVEIRQSSSINKGDLANVTSISMSAHTATHLDAPLHFFNNGKDITQLSLAALIGCAKVFHILNKKSIALDEIKKFPIEKGDRILFRTFNSDVDWPLKDFRKDYIYLDKDAAEYLKEKEVYCVGIDYLSIASEETAADVHRILLGSEIVVIEGLWLKDVDEGSYDMICLPLKIKGADGAPARVLLKKTN